MIAQPKVSQCNSNQPSKEKGTKGRKSGETKEPTTFAATPMHIRDLVDDSKVSLRVPALTGMFGSHLAVEKDNKSDFMNQRINFSKLKSELRDKLLFNDAEFK